MRFSTLARPSTRTVPAPATTFDLGNGSPVRHARRVLAQELADYATVAERDDLAALLDGRGSAGSLAADILSRQAHQELFRTR